MPHFQSSERKHGLGWGNSLLTVFNKAQHDKSPSSQPFASSLVVRLWFNFGLLELKINHPTVLLYLSVKVLAPQMALESCSFLKQDDLLAFHVDLNFSFSLQLYKRKERRRRNERQHETEEDTVEQE